MSWAAKGTEALIAAERKRDRLRRNLEANDIADCGLCRAPKSQWCEKHEAMLKEYAEAQTKYLELEAAYA